MKVKQQGSKYGGRVISLTKERDGTRQAGIQMIELTSKGSGKLDSHQRMIYRRFG